MFGAVPEWGVSWSNKACFSARFGFTLVEFGFRPCSCRGAGRHPCLSEALAHRLPLLAHDQVCCASKSKGDLCFTTATTTVTRHSLVVSHFSSLLEQKPLSSHHEKNSVTGLSNAGRPTVEGWGSFLLTCIGVTAEKE